jgi:hypothetical protein
MSLKALDEICLRGMVSRERVNWEFAGGIYAGTCGARDTMRELVDGGIINDQDFALLVPLEAVGALAVKPQERSIISVCVDNDGIPCSIEDAVEARVPCRITKIGRALAGLTYTLTTVQRG